MSDSQNSAVSASPGKTSRRLALTPGAAELLEAALRTWWDGWEERPKSEKTGRPKMLSREDKAAKLEVNIKTMDRIFRCQPVSEAVLKIAFHALKITPPFSRESHCVIETPQFGNLPPAPAPCIGRETDIAAVKALFRKRPLVTLTGIGGVGKTRLALAVGEELRTEFAAGVWLVRLEDVTDSARVPQQIAAALGLQEAQNGDCLTALTNFLHKKPLLLILDNCEHVLAACITVADCLLSSSSKTKILATSRERFNLPYERPYPVPSLDAPDRERLANVNGGRENLLLEYAAARLFVERAEAARPGFRVTEQNALLIASICCRLDGIPLALELAAGRCEAMSLKELESRLARCFPLLIAGGGAVDRHKTLQTMMDWSYDLLHEEEQTLLRRLSVFAGGGTLEAVETVCQGETIATGAATHLLLSLTKKSLVVYEEDDAGQGRYRLLEIVRQYGRQGLEAKGELETAAKRHRDYFALRAAEINRELAKSGQSCWLDAMEAEYANLEQAINFSLEDPAGGEPGLRLGAALQEFWWTRGNVTESRKRYAALLEHPQAQGRTEARASALNGAGILARMQGDNDAARLLHEASQEIYRELRDKHGLAFALGNLAIVYCVQGDIEGAGPLFQESLRLHRALENEKGIAYSLGNLAKVHYIQKDYAAAHPLFVECLERHQRLKNEAGTATCLEHLGSIAAHRQDYVSAHSLLKQGLEIHHRLRNVSDIVSYLTRLAHLACKSKDWEQAAHLYGAAEQLRRKIDIPVTRSSEEQDEYHRNLAEARDALGHAAFSQAEAAGGAMSLKQAVKRALNGDVS